MNFRKIASNKHVGLRKIENLVGSKFILKIYRKLKEKKANFRKSCKSVKFNIQMEKKGDI